MRCISAFKTISTRCLIFKILSLIVTWGIPGLWPFWIIIIRVFGVDAFFNENLAQSIIFCFTSDRLSRRHAETVLVATLWFFFLRNCWFCGFLHVLLMKVFNLFQFRLRFFKQIYFWHGGSFFLVDSGALLNFFQLFHKKFLFVIKLVQPLKNNIWCKFICSLHLFLLIIIFLIICNIFCR